MSPSRLHTILFLIILNTIDASNITCTAGSDCNIDCVVQSCANIYIDATEANSLSLDCSTASGNGYGCQNSKIQCPSNDYKSCTIDCTEASSCRSMSIEMKSTISNNFILQCHNDESCFQTSVMFLSKNITNVEFKCDASNSCQNLFIRINNSTINTFSFLCSTEYSCYFSRVYAAMSSIDHLYIYCNNKSACRNFVFFDSIINYNADIKCLGCENAAFRFYGNDLINTNNLSLECEENACWLTKLYAYNFSKVIVQCNGIDACEYVTIAADQSLELDLTCNAESCNQPYIYCPYDKINSCNIDLTEPMTFLYIYVPSFYSHGYLNITLTRSESSDITPQRNYVGVICNTEKKAVNLIYTESKDLVCDYASPWYCCPFAVQNPTFCASSGECVVNCDESTDLCSHTIIDGTISDYLTVDCVGHNSCQFTTIYCPAGGCQVICRVDSCQNNLLFYNGTSSDNGNIFVQCNGFCIDTIIDAPYIAQINIDCNHCDGIIVNAQYANQVHINNINVTKSSIWNFSNAQSVNINAKGTGSFADNTVDARNADSLTVMCSSASDSWGSTWTACDSKFYIPYETIFNCYGAGCVYIDLYMSTYPLDISGLQINLYECQVCDSVGSCLNYFELHCNYNASCCGDFEINKWERQKYMYDVDIDDGERCNVESTAYVEYKDCGCIDIVNNAHFFEGRDYDQCIQIGDPIECEPDTDCDIDCVDTTVTDCEYELIDGTLSNYLTVNCGESDERNGCDRASIHCPVGGCTIICKGGCFLTKIYAEFSKQVIIDVKKATFNGYLYAQNAGSATITCSEDKGLIDTSCSYAQWFLPNDTTINCYGLGCTYMGDIFIHHDTSGIKFNMKPCDECDDIQDCLRRVALHCIDSYHSSIDYGWSIDVSNNGFECSIFGANDCGCTNLITLDDVEYSGGDCEKKSVVSAVLKIIGMIVGICVLLSCCIAAVGFFCPWVFVGICYVCQCCVK